MRNVELTPLKLSTWRKIALGTWNKGGDPSVYGSMDINVSLIQKRQKLWVEKTGEKAPTMTVIVAKATAMTLKNHPQVNGLVRFGKIYLRKTVTIFLQTAVDDAGHELSGVVIHNAEDKSLKDMASELKQKAHAIRTDQDPNFKKAKNSFSILPAFVMKYVLDLLSFFMYTLNINLEFIGLPKDPFGSVMITSIGSLGLEEAYAPLVPYSRVPLLVSLGATINKPIVAKDGSIVAAPVVRFCVTIDHRFIDGFHGAKMAKAVRHYLETEQGLNELGL